MRRIYGKMADNQTGIQKKILVVDDSATIRSLIKKELEDAGFLVEEAENGLQALAKAADNEPPDLITLDVDMPGLDGFSTYQKFREKHYTRFFTHIDNATIPIIFLTSNDTIEARERGFSLGAADFITKPFNHGDLKAIVEEILFPPSPFGEMYALVVDDNATSRKVVVDNLKRQGLKINEAENGKEAFELISDNPDKYDIVITDFIMPEMDGKTLCEKIRKDLLNKTIPIIFLTAITEQSQLLEVFSSGASDYIIKPFFKEELMARVSSHLGARKLNRDLKESIKKLQKNQKEQLIQEKNKGALEMSGTLCHELNQPLQNISGYTELIKLHINDEDAIKKYIDKINNEIGRMADLTKKIMKITSYSTKSYPGAHDIIDINTIKTD